MSIFDSDSFVDYSNIDLTGYTVIPVNFLQKLRANISPTPLDLESETGLHFLRADNSDRLFWPIHYKVVDEKKWAIARLKFDV